MDFNVGVTLTKLGALGDGLWQDKKNGSVLSMELFARVCASMPRDRELRIGSGDNDLTLIHLLD